LEIRAKKIRKSGENLESFTKPEADPKAEQTSSSQTKKRKLSFKTSQRLNDTRQTVDLHTHLPSEYQESKKEEEDPNLAQADTLKTWKTLEEKDKEIKEENKTGIKKPQSEEKKRENGSQTRNMNRKVFHSLDSDKRSQKIDKLEKFDKLEKLDKLGMGEGSKGGLLPVAVSIPGICGMKKSSELFADSIDGLDPDLFGTAIGEIDLPCMYNDKEEVNYEVKDLSTNGTFLNGERLTKNQYVQIFDNDQIGFVMKRNSPTPIVIAGFTFRIPF